MSNRIHHIKVENRLLNSAEAEIWVRIAPEQVTPTTEIRGRLLGPRCLYSSTVEVAYPLRPLPKPLEGALEGAAGVWKRIVVPEPCLWDPISPFLYEGPVELWENDQLCDRVPIAHGFRSFRMGPKGLMVNGKLFAIEATESNDMTPAEVPGLRNENCNCLIAPVDSCARELWEAADRAGILMLGRLSPFDGLLASSEKLQSHPSCLGWLVNKESLGDIGIKEAIKALRQGFPDQWFGLETDRIPATAPKGFNFIVCVEEALAFVVETPLPIVIREPYEPADSQSRAIIGSIRV